VFHGRNSAVVGSIIGFIAMVFFRIVPLFMEGVNELSVARLKLPS